MDDLVEVDVKDLTRWNQMVPRYTSYPTAPQFKPLDESKYIEHLQNFDKTNKPLSLYFHIPFCKTMCLFCGCSVVLNRNPERQSKYVFHLLQEIDLLCKKFASKRVISQIHFGGGTPTSLTEEEFEKIMQKIRDSFFILDDAEISIEVDPRTVVLDQGKKLKYLKKAAFNRISFGVQDLDPKVQEAVRRRQSEEMTVSTYFLARELGFSEINIDLIYGLPFQTVKSFEKTADKLIELKPDRIAFYSYAKVPWIKAHQRAIDEKTLPSMEEKFQIYVNTRARFMKAGYVAIGMDHFSLKTDSIAKAYVEKRLTRNFQGYSVGLSEDMIGIGLTSIGFIENGFFQNIKDLTLYQEHTSKGILPVERGFILNEDDILRRAAIQEVMCHFEIDKKKYGALANFTPLIDEGFLINTKDKYIVTPLGKLFVRLIASQFDVYLTQGQFSKVI